jgi:excisionase family DNA binding protein
MAPTILPLYLTPAIHNDPLFNNDQSANYIGVTPRTMEVWRCTKRHKIPYIKVGRLVKYRKSSLDTFLNQQTVCAE